MNENSSITKLSAFALESKEYGLLPLSKNLVATFE